MKNNTARIAASALAAATLTLAGCSSNPTPQQRRQTSV